MTRDEAVKVLKLIKGYTHINLSEWLPVEVEAMDMAISALSVLDQIRWERDIALETLEEHGIGLGQKGESDDDYRNNITASAE